MRKIPIWATKYQEKLNKLADKAGGAIYSPDQDDLKILEKTGRGNCVAMSNLFRKILKRYRVPFQHLIIGEYNIKKDSHQITIVYESETSIWLQSNDYLYEFYSLSSLMYHAEKEMGWEKSGMKIIESRWVLL